MKFSSMDWEIVRKVKAQVQNLPPMELPPEGSYVILETDGCIDGWGGVAKWRAHKGSPRSEEKAFAYCSGKFPNPKSTIDAEIYACINTLEGLKIHYLDQPEVTLRTDCVAIINFYNKQVNNKPSRVRWLLFTDYITGSGVKIIFEHIDGSKNILADKLSRLTSGKDTAKMAGDKGKAPVIDIDPEEEAYARTRKAPLQRTMRFGQEECEIPEDEDEEMTEFRNLSVQQQCLIAAVQNAVTPEERLSACRALQAYFKKLPQEPLGKNFSFYALADGPYKGIYTSYYSLCLAKDQTSGYNRFKGFYSYPEALAYLQERLSTAELISMVIEEYPARMKRPRQDEILNDIIKHQRAFAQHQERRFAALKAEMERQKQPDA